MTVQTRWWWLRFLSGFAAVALTAWPADAAPPGSTTGDLTVLVVAPSEVDVRVAISAASSTEPRWTSTITGGRRRTFSGLQPDRYTVTAGTPPAATSETTLVIEPGETAYVEVTPSATAAPRVEVVFQHRPGQGMTFTSTDLATLPSGNNLWALLDAAAPFVITDRIDAGGLATGRAVRVGSRGASWTATSLYVGDEEIDGATTRGLSLFYPDFAGLGSVSVLSGLADPFIGTPGAAVAIVPRRPGDHRRARIGGAFTAPGMVAADRGPAPTIHRMNDWQEGHLVWDGPVTPRVGAVIGASFSRLSGRERDEPAPFSSRVASFTAHVVASPTDRDEVRLLASAQSIRQPYDGAPRRSAPIAGESDRLFGVQMTWDRFGAGGSRMTGSAGFRRGTFSPDAGAAMGGTIDRTAFGPVPTPASDDATRSVNGRLSFAPATQRLAGLDHSLRADVEIRHRTASAAVTGTPVFAELVAGIPARAWVARPAGSRSDRRATSTVFAMNDEIALSRRLTFTLGLRAELASGEADGAAERIQWHSAAPLAMLRWRPRAIALTAGYRRYSSPLTTGLLAFGDPGEPLIDVYRWADANADGAFAETERGVLVARAGRGAAVATIAPGLSPSYTDEFSLRAERRIGHLHHLRLTATIRTEHDIVRSINTGAPLSAYQALSVPNEIGDPKRARDGLLTVYDRRPETFGQDFYVLDNAPGEGARYRGLELAWEMRSARWYSLFGATAFESSGAGGNRGFRSTEADQGTMGELLENPNARSFVDSRLFFDRAYVAKWSAGFRGPHDITTAATVRYQDGQPFARMVLVPGLAQGAEIVAADYSEATRFTFTGTIDLRVAKSFALQGRRLTLMLDVFNVSNLAEEVEEDAVGGPAFRSSTAMQPTRTARVGFQLEF